MIRKIGVLSDNHAYLCMILSSRSVMTDVCKVNFIMLLQKFLHNRVHIKSHFTGYALNNIPNSFIQTHFILLKFFNGIL